MPPTELFYAGHDVADCFYQFSIPRWLGQHGLTGPDSPIRHRAKRRRIRTVMQELMYLAARLIESGRRLKLAFDRSCASATAFAQLYQDLAYG